MSKTNIHYWLALKLVSRLAIHKKLSLVDSIGLNELFSSSFSTPSLAAYGLSTKQIAMIRSPDWNKINAIILASKQCNCEIIVFDDPKYSNLLKQIYDPPLVLFVQGNAELLQKRQLAIVGSRSSSVNGRDTASKMAERLVNESIVITSGLAIGIDAAAHKGALKGQGKTIAVVATGLDKVYPHRHRYLAEEILKAEGAIVSEFIPGTLPKPGHFPRRNRLISGLSFGVLVVEATMKSGSLITARSAMEQNRDVFAIPSSINNPQAQGCHWLIKQGAKLVTDIADIVEELDFSQQLGLNLSSIHELVGDVEKKLAKSVNEDLFIEPLLASVGYEITPVDVVVSRSELPIEEVLTRLTILELKGLVAALPGGYIKLNSE